MNLEDRNLIRRLYSKCSDKIKREYPRFDPYILDWNDFFTPIETNVWHDIRSNGLPFLPQYPVGKYFIDFADPIKKIGIEVDGKEFHKDKIKDDLREDELNRLGWWIFRVKGANTFYDFDNYDFRDNENYEEFMEHKDISRLPSLFFNYFGDTYNGSFEKMIRMIKKDFYTGDNFDFKSRNIVSIKEIINHKLQNQTIGSSTP